MKYSYQIPSFISKFISKVILKLGFCNTFKVVISFLYSFKYLVSDLILFSLNACFQLIYFILQTVLPLQRFFFEVMNNYFAIMN